MHPIVQNGLQLIAPLDRPLQLLPRSSWRHTGGSNPRPDFLKGKRNALSTSLLPSNLVSLNMPCYEARCYVAGTACGPDDHATTTVYDFALSAPKYCNESQSDGHTVALTAESYPKVRRRLHENPFRCKQQEAAFLAFSRPGDSCISAIVWRWLWPRWGWRLVLTGRRRQRLVPKRGENTLIRHERTGIVRLL